MKFVCSSKSFTEAFNNVALAVDCRSQIPALQGILLSCGGNEVTLTGYDLELTITKRLEARTEEDGKIILVYNLFRSFFNGYTPIGDRLHVEVSEKNEIAMETKESRKWIKVESFYEYPGIPEFVAEKRIVLPSSKLAYMLNWVTKTVFDKNDTVPLISGALFKLSDSRLNIIAVDGSYAHKSSEPVKVDGNFSFAVPRKTILAMNRILKDCDSLEQAEIAVSSESMSLTVDGYTLVSPLSSTEDFEKRIKELGFEK